MLVSNYCLFHLVPIIPNNIVYMAINQPYVHPRRLIMHSFKYSDFLNFYLPTLKDHISQYLDFDPIFKENPVVIQTNFF